MLTPVPGRSCVEAGVPIAFCNCYQLAEVDVKDAKVNKAADAFVKTVNEALTVMNGKCAKLTLKKIDESRKVKKKDIYVLQMIMEPKGKDQE